MRRAKILKRSIRSLILALVILFSSSCVEAGAQSYLGVEIYEIDPLFREIYNHYGEGEILGPAISPLFINGLVSFQYTTTVLLVHDPQAPANQRFYLASLGVDLGIAEPPVPAPTQPGVLFLNGHVVFEDFIPLYQKLGGEIFAGRPITEMHFNPDTRRYEQHFENVGMYRIDGDAPGRVHLLSYGASKCADSCLQVTIPLNSKIEPHPAPSGPFAEAVRVLGADFIGYALTNAYPAGDGLTEQIFENLVLVTDPADPSSYHLRPITQMLGIMPDALGSPSLDPYLYFYPIQGELGYSVPRSFFDYLATRGGLEVSGPPVTEYSPIRENVYRQCFQNICLEEHHNQTGMVYVRPAASGYKYRNLYPWGAPQPALQQPTSEPMPENPVPESQPEPPVEEPIVAGPVNLEVQPPAPAPEMQPTVANSTDDLITNEISLQVWEMYPSISPNQSQEIGVVIYENNQPLIAVEPDLVLMLPDGSSRSYFLYPTGSDGQTTMLLEPINAPNGTLIPYQVCLIHHTGAKFCVKDSFLIYQEP